MYAVRIRSRGRALRCAALHRRSTRGMKKVPQISAEEAARLVKDGDVLLAGGFGMTGNPVHLLHALAETQVKDLTYVGNNVGEAGLGGGRLLRNGQATEAGGSYLTRHRDAVAAARSQALEGKVP